MAEPNRRELEIRFGTDRKVSAILLEPQDPLCLYVLAHGAGAGMRHPGLESLAQRFAREGIATLRYQFHYMEQGSRRPDPPPLLHAAVRAAIGRAAELRPDLPLFAGGRSMGGRMTSQAQAKEALPGVRGLIFLAFPLHPPKRQGAERPSTERAAHLSEVRTPMLFLSGDRDGLADLTLLRGVCDSLGDRAHLHVVSGGDHSFGVLKRSGRTALEVEDEIATVTRGWIEGVR